MRPTLLLLFFAAITAHAQPDRMRLLQLDSALNQLQQQAMFNGVVLLADQGMIFYKKALGVANIASGEALHTRSSFNLASVSKQFTATMILQLKEQGKLRLDDRVQKHLPLFPYANITLRQLLTHSSGLPEYFDLILDHRTTIDTLDNAGVLRLLAEQKPDCLFAPGEKWSYSNTGYVLLALVIEKCSGMTFAQFFQQQIAAPLGMKDSYVYTVKTSHSPPNRVLGFKRENGINTGNDLTRFDGIVGDGNVYASAEDLLRWDRALYSEQILSKASKKEMFSPLRLNDGSLYPYGLGWMMDSTGKTLSHTGAWTGFRTKIKRNTASQQCLIILSSGTDGRAIGVAEAILEGQKVALPQLQLIQNVSLIDGSGAPARNCSVRIRDERIWETGDLTPLPGETVTDGKGLTLAPGFIDSHSHHFGGLTTKPDGLALSSQGITSIVIGQDGSSYWMDTLEAIFKRQKMAINVATYAGHTTLREEAMGENDMLRLSTAAELRRMKKRLESELNKGALGLSTGLEYEHAFFSSRQEVIELSKVTAKQGGRYISHIRSEDIRLEEAIEELLEIGRKAKLPVQISHIKMAKRDQWGKASLLLAELEKARAEGIDVTADCYPYDFWNSTLRVLFPNRDYSNPQSAELAVTQLCDPDKSIVVAFEPNKAYAGKSLSAIAAMRGEATAQTLMYLVAAADTFDNKYPDFQGNSEGIMGKSMDESDIEAFLAWPHTNICSDGSWGGHPRGHGAFTRVLGRYVRERKIMSLEHAIYKMTGLSAEHLGMGDRGLIAPGYWADLVLFNPATVLDQADVDNPTALSAGIEAVWVNGQLIYQDQKASGVRPGRLIKRTTTHE